MDFRDHGERHSAASRALKGLRSAAIAALAVGAMVGCRRGHYEPEPVYRSEWRVANLTDNHSLRIVAPPYGYAQRLYSDKKLLNGQRLLGREWLIGSVEDGRGGHEFAMLMECWRGWDEANITFEVLAADGTPLARWRYAERGGEGRQFFDPARWRHSTETEGSRGEVSLNVWTFEILPEDIIREVAPEQPEEPEQS